MNKKISVGLAVTLALIAMTVTFSVTFELSRQRFTVTMNSVREREQMYAKLAEMDKYVRDNYFGEINDEKLLDMLGAGYVLGIEDKNASYYTARQYSELMDIQNGKLLSIGVEVVKDASSGYAMITRVYPGSPADEVGLQKGMFITRVDNTEVKSLTRDAVNALLRGEEGTGVTLSYLNAENVAVDGLELQRRKFDASTVDFQLLESMLGYVKINVFNNSTPADLDAAVRQLMDQGALGLIFDVRGNGGGMLSSAVDCLDILCPEGVLARARYKDGTVEIMGNSDENEVALPMAVVVNRETASAAELFAAELREYGKAKLVGTTTYGKGTLQREPYRLSDGSAVAVTVAELLTGDGNSFNGTGLSPDVEAVMKAEDEKLVYFMLPEEDAQISKAISLLSAQTGAGQTNTPESGDAQPDSAGSEAEPAADSAASSAAEG